MACQYYVLSSELSYSRVFKMPKRGHDPFEDRVCAQVTSSNRNTRRRSPEVCVTSFVSCGPCAYTIY